MKISADSNINYIISGWDLIKIELLILKSSAGLLKKKIALLKLDAYFAVQTAV